ncbi:aldolase [Nibricoccus aquaticus]|uniref:Aldolase n=1 Tax=Nibricoccus aquaticus TaxID=2576891 RepID=A0A290Q8J8_9BACT|nr:class II aldolase/adducin family protein [Nibricoccus aquaticus]ATC64567.1 aldolase [Nibricoccus aquaticus]
MPSPNKPVAPAPNPSALPSLLSLSHDLGREDRALAILGEGNTSTRVSESTFIVKASGSNLATLAPENVTACRFDKLLPLLDKKSLPDAAIDEALLASREDASAKKPSVEAIFHAFLLTLPGVNFVGHTHPNSVNSLLCSKWGKTFATRRLFPDEIVCCGEASVFVPYTDPGLKLAQTIRRETLAFVKRTGQPPRIILLENHGLIALGASPNGVLAATLMADKAARIFLGATAASGGKSPQFLTPAQVARIAGRPDEHYRRKMLKL